jgi:hypothetical protein
VSTLDQDPDEYGNEVRARVEQFVAESDVGQTGRVRRVELQGAGDTMTVVVSFTMRAGALSQEWPIWDETNPFNAPWVPAFEVSEEISIEIAELLRNEGSLNTSPGAD